MSRGKLSRRAFVRATGLAAVALPFMRSARTRAGAGTFPKRLVVFAVPNGTRIESFWPADGGSFADRRILAPLAAFQPKAIAIRGIDIESAQVEPVPEDHWPDNLNMLTARQAQRVDGSWAPGGISIDQHIAATMTTPERSLHLGVVTGGYCGSISARQEGGTVYAVRPQTNPFEVARQLFADVSTDPFGYERLRNDRGSVLDAVRGEISALECKLGREDRYKLDAHLTSISEIQHSLDALHDACAPPELGAEFSPSRERYPDVGDLQMKLAVAAIACDRTRVVTLMWHQGASNMAHTWSDVPYTHHGISHNSEGVDEPETTRHEWLTRVSTFYATELAKLCQALEDIPEGDGTMLDNTAVLWAHEQADGATHRRRDLPYLLVGSCGGAFRTGRAIDFGGVPHSGLLMSLANAMGVPTTEFGDPAFSRGPLTDLG